MNQRVFITGFGIISGIGMGETETLRSLLEKRSGISAVSFLDTALKQYPVSEVKYTNEQLIELAGLPTDKTYSRTFLLGLLAAREALRMAGYENQDLREMGLIGSTTVGGMDLNEKYYSELRNGKENNTDLLQSLECCSATENIAVHFGIKSQVTTISTACSSSANAIITGTRMIKNGLLDTVLAGGMDALSKFSLNGFNSLEILSPTGCQPFDKNRNGVTLGEGAAFLVLESEEKAKGKKIYGEISGYANRNEAYHQTASSPDGYGAKITVSAALKKANLPPKDIDYVNAHGTGTEINDLSEGKAIEEIFKDKIPSVSSTKGYTGHTLAAAGAIEAVISLLSLKHQQIFPNLRMKNPMEELSFTPVNEVRKAEIRHILSNSFGFGGSNAALIISKTD